MSDPLWHQRCIQVMPAHAAPHAFDLPARLAVHNPKWSGEDAPLGFWGRGAPLGNGDLGALLYGPPENLTFILGKNDIWIRNSEKSRFPGKCYAEMIRIYREADRAAFDKLKPTDPHWLDHYHPDSLTNAGLFRLHLAEPAGVRKFEQELRLFDATCVTRFEAPGLDRQWSEHPDFEVTTFVSGPHEVMAIRVRRHRLPLRSFTWRLGREAHHMLPPVKAGSDGRLAWIEQAMPKGDRYAIAALQVGMPVDLTTAKRSIIGEGATNTANEVTFFLAAATHRDATDPLALARYRVEEAAALGFETLHEAHRDAWAKSWGRSWVACGDPAVERPWYISNYLAGSTLRPGKQSPGLQGMWCKENLPPWLADFHGNANIQAIYQGIMGSNRMDLFEPCARLYHHMLPQCRRDTREYFGVEGARLPHAGGIDGHELTEDAWITLATSMTPSMWIARLFWWAYQHNLDREFLAHVAYPVIRDVAVFYRGLLELTGKGSDGRYTLAPSIYGEAHATSLEGWGGNSSYDNIACRVGLTQAAEAAEVLGVDAGPRAQWRQAVADLPPLPVDHENVLLWWEKQTSKFNGRVAAGSFFQPAFPAELAGAFHGTEEMRRLVFDTWNKFAKASTSSPWCAGMPVAAAARLGDADWCFRLARNPAVNGLGASIADGVMQADNGTGFSLALNSMLLLGVDGKSILFAGMPAEQDAAFHSLRAPGAILASGEQRGGKVTHAALQAIHGGAVCLLNPYKPVNGESIMVKVTRGDNGESAVRGHFAYRAPLTWQATPGVIYKVEAVIENA
jgi:hypothetical protein